VSGIAEDAGLDGRFVKGERERLLARAFMMRVIVLMTLMPEARAQDAVAALAGDLALVPWARPWRPASARAAGNWRNALGAAPLEDLRDTVLGAAWRRHQDEGCPGAVTTGRTRRLKAGAFDGTLIRVPDTPANRAFFGSVGTGNDSSPFPQARALPVTCCSCRALFALPHGPAGTEKAAAGQSLLDEALRDYPALFAPDWIWLMDRNYWAEVEGQDVPEMFCLVTDLMDWEEHPAPELAALYKWRWDGSETALREVKAPLRGAGPGTGPMLRSGSPELVRQELAAWAAGTAMTRGVVLAAARAAHPAGKGRRAGLEVRPRDLSFGRALRAVLSAIRLGHDRFQAVTSEIAGFRNVVDRDRHRARKSKSPSAFPHATPKDTVIRTAPAVITMANTPA
jgi:hypothetical protein